MGLVVSVGVLHEVEGDPEGRQVRADLERLNESLVAAGLSAHEEPSDVPPSLRASFDMVGYSGLHCLRRYAARLWARRRPEPLRAGQDPSADPCLVRYYRRCDWTVGPAGVRMFDSSGWFRPRFDHLVFHGDADGYYVPIRMPGVLVTWREGSVYSEAIGSSFALRDECERLAKRIRVPLDLDPEGDVIWEAADDPKPDAGDWRAFGIEAFTVLRLYHAARRSVEARAVLAFS